MSRSVYRSRSRSRSRRGRRPWLWASAAAAGIASVACLMLLVGSGAAGAGGVDCPSTATDQVVLVGLSSSGRNPSHIEERRAEVRHQFEVAGDCNVDLIVRGWSTAGAVRTLWGLEDELEITGQTESGRDRRLDGVVDEAMAEFDERLQAALEELPADGSDFLAWPALAVDAIHELGGQRPVQVTVLDDGVQTANPDLNEPLTVADASQLATAHAPEAQLDGVEVTIKGVGQIAGDPAPAGGEWVPAVQAFAQQTCDATHADCTVLTATN
jgi:hypothetical protein